VSHSHRAARVRAPASYTRSGQLAGCRRKYNACVAGYGLNKYGRRLAAPGM
jgi:hypothetical protein